jgi:hypothetical protein
MLWAYNGESFRDKSVKRKIINTFYPPFNFPPRGEKYITPSPLGEVPIAIGREGGK